MLHVLCRLGGGGDAGGVGIQAHALNNAKVWYAADFMVTHTSVLAMIFKRGAVPPMSMCPLLSKATPIVPPLTDGRVSGRCGEFCKVC